MIFRHTHLFLFPSSVSGRLQSGRSDSNFDPIGLLCFVHSFSLFDFILFICNSINAPEFAHDFPSLRSLCSSREFYFSWLLRIHFLVLSAIFSQAFFLLGLSSHFLFHSFFFFIFFFLSFSSLHPYLRPRISFLIGQSDAYINRQAVDITIASAWFLAWMHPHTRPTSSFFFFHSLSLSLFSLSRSFFFLSFFSPPFLFVLTKLSVKRKLGVVRGLKAFSVQSPCE